MTATLDLLGSIAILVGGLLALLGAVGMLRLPDIYSRMHAATKPHTLGLLMILVGLALSLRTWAAVATLLIVMAAQALTAPVAAHMIGRSAYRAGTLDPALLHRDELAEALRADDEGRPSD